MLPEKIGILEPDWGDVRAVFERVAPETHSRVVVGVQERGTQDANVALAFEVGGVVERYVKRHLIPHFEPLVPGNAAGLISNGGALEICKDMDFQGRFGVRSQRSQYRIRSSLGLRHGSGGSRKYGNHARCRKRLCGHSFGARGIDHDK